MKLKSGREVELKGLTTRQRMKCKDTVTQTLVDSEHVAFGNLYEAKLWWVVFGLGFDSIDDLDKMDPPLSDDEIIEISLAVQEADEKSRNPITKG